MSDKQKKVELIIKHKPQLNEKFEEKKGSLQQSLQKKLAMGFKLFAI